MLTLSNARIRRGPQVLLDAATVTLFRGEKVGIVGRNGCGKSTLLALIRGEIATDAGEYRAPPGLAIASVAQDLPDSPRALLDYIQDGDEELREVEAQLRQAHERNDGTLQATLHARYESLDGYRAASRAAQLAVGLGFDSADLQRGLAEFSGGLRMRANLARALMRRSDVLLLDEPTSHLDMESVESLVESIGNYNGAVVIVTHSEMILKAVATRLVVFEPSGVVVFPGTYEEFLESRGWEEELPDGEAGPSRLPVAMSAGKFPS